MFRNKYRVEREKKYDTAGCGLPPSYVVQIKYWYFPLLWFKQHTFSSSTPANECLERKRNNEKTIQR